ncbi:TetR family transcriptional regulator [Actinocatenispora comari]|uniref:HTH tetR-type domain-containing protein n=1 Tax=Actinocatenispora comari TaxID=2807577 RepID=A0A8J4ELW8_9ACTN|nr:TetR/AcrR family transcriptional regulator [Actinocatenispora comari]GIL29722.1 hypothetical protein NUM_49760 [Actinocatenispora comari]
MDDGHIARRRGAPPAGQRLSRDAVLARAEDLIDADGYDRFSLRALAAALGVRPNALYNHVGGREELLDAVAERYLAEFVLPDTGEPWPEWVRTVAIGLRAQLLDHPERAALLLSRAGGTALGPVVLRRFVDRLVAAGVDRAIAHLGWHLMLTTVVGTVQQERRRGKDPAGTFEAVLDVALRGLVAVAAAAPDERATMLLAAHRLAHPQP